MAAEEGSAGGSPPSAAADLGAEPPEGGVADVEQPDEGVEAAAAAAHPSDRQEANISGEDSRPPLDEGPASVPSAAGVGAAEDAAASPASGDGEKNDGGSDSEEAPSPSPSPPALRASRRSSRGRGCGRGRGARGRGRGRGRGRVKDEDGGGGDEPAASDQESEDEADLGLRLGSRILQDLLNTNSTFLHYPEAKKGMVDYHDVIEKPMWFEEIQRRFDDEEYSSIVDFVKDVRLLLLNVYRYFGRDALVTKRALRIEQVFEYKLASLPKDLRSQCLLMSTHGIKTSDNENEEPNVRKTGDFFSHLLESVSGEREQRKNRLQEKLSEEKKLNEGGCWKEALDWETKVLLDPVTITQMRSMWEIPLIGHLIQLTVQVLCIDQVPQYEVERMFLMPQASKSLAGLMTSLLSPPIQRSKLQSYPPMPYSIWSQKLAQRVAGWYKMFQTRNQNWLKIFELCGIEKDFWNILGDWNQLEDYEFHELSLHQRVWLVKSLCDYQVHNHKTMQDALAEHSLREQNCVFLGTDRHDRQYLHFPQLCSAPGLCTCVRVYRCVIPEEKSRTPDPSGEVPLASIRMGTGDFMPAWMRGRGRGKGRAGRKNHMARKKAGAEINNRKFLSRVVYRMPNGMHIRGRRKRGANRPSESSVYAQQDEKTSCGSAVPQPPLPTSSDHPSDSEDKLLNQDAEKADKRITRQTRSRQNTFLGYYADWSDSESVSTPSSSSSISKKLPKQSRAFSSISYKTDSSSRNHHNVPLAIEDSKTSPKPSDEFGSVHSDDEEMNKSPDAEEDVSSHESGCDEGASRGAWSTPATPDGKVDDCGEDSDNTDDEKDEMVDDFSWMPSDRKLECKNKQKRPHFNPESMLLGTKHFVLVADSVQAVRALTDSLCEENDDVDLMQRLNNLASSSRPICEEKLELRLRELINEIATLELKMETNTRKLRKKLFDEWNEYKNRQKGSTDEAEIYWLSILKSGMDIPATVDKVEIKGDEENISTKLKLQDSKSNENDAEAQDEDSMTGYDIRHSLRAKKPKIDNPQHSWLHSDSEEEESDEEQDDAWVMPGRRRRKRPSAGRSRKSRKDIKSDDEKSVEKVPGVLKNFSFESFESEKQCDQDNEDSKSISKDKLKVNQKLLPNKLTLDKEGHMFITLGCGTKVSLEKDDDGRIVVPDGHEGLSMVRGKTLEQLVGSGKVVQNRKKRNNSTRRRVPPMSPPDYRESQPLKRSTTLFPALPPSVDIVQAKEWTPPVMKDNVLLNSPKHQGVLSIQAKEWTPPLENKLSASSAGTPQVKTYVNRKKALQQVSKNTSEAQKKCSPVKKSTEPEEVVVLSDGSDDSIEVIKESDPKGSMQNGGPRIQSVIGNVVMDSFTPKPLTSSVTMTPVVVPKTNSPNNSANKPKQWSPVISNTVSLEPVSTGRLFNSVSLKPVPAGRVSNSVTLQSVSSCGRVSNVVSLAPSPSSSRVRAPGAPQVVITPAKNVPSRRNLQQTVAFHQPMPNQSFVPVSSFSTRQAQPQFVPVNQMMPVSNQFQPITQIPIVSMDNQYIVTNASFAQAGNSYMVNTAPAYQYVPVTPMSGPLPLPVSAFDMGLPPGLTGQIVLANADNNQFSYAFKLDDGGLIFLSNEQVCKIRAANGGKLTTMVQFQTH